MLITKPRVIILVMLAGCIGIAFPTRKLYAQKSPDVSHSESRAWIKDTKDGKVFVTENATFDFVPLLNDDGEHYTNLLVLHSDHDEWNPEREGVNGTLKVTAWTVLGNGHQKARWTFNASGNQGRPLPDIRMFQVSSWPCCSAPFENTYFSLLNGKRLYSTNGVPEKGIDGQDSDLIRVDGGYDGTHYTQTRFVGFGGSPLSGSASVQYGTDSSIKQKFALLGHDYGDNFDVPDLSIAEDGKNPVKDLQVEGQFSFIVVLKFDDGPEVRIPVENDVVRIDKAILPKGYSLRVEIER